MGWVHQWWDAASTHLSLPAREVADYRVALLERYANPNIRHLLGQIATDGSQKMPIRAVPVVQAGLRHGTVDAGAARLVAAWVAHLRGHGARVTDVQADKVTALAQGQPAAAVARVLAWLGFTTLPLPRPSASSWASSPPSQRHERHAPDQPAYGASCSSTGCACRGVRRGSGCRGRRARHTCRTTAAVAADRGDDPSAASRPSPGPPLAPLAVLLSASLILFMACAVRPGVGSLGNRDPHPRAPGTMLNRAARVGPRCPRRLRQSRAVELDGEILAGPLEHRRVPSAMSGGQVEQDDRPAGDPRGAEQGVQDPSSGTASIARPMLPITEPQLQARIMRE